jgi:malonate decarboxylase beta subunit
MKLESFSELNARERATCLLDANTFREILGPFSRYESPHLEPQGIVPQSDDGVVVGRGQIRGHEAVVLSMVCAFQGGSIGEVNGAKIAAALEFALRDARKGLPIFPVLIFDTGGIRLHEANLGILAISEIHSAIVALREVVPVIGIIGGRVGCFGGMGIAAGLCSVLIGSEIGRLGLNGPEVIEQEAGLDEFDSKDRPLIWSTMGCRRRFEVQQIDTLVDDAVDAVVAAVREQCRAESFQFRRPSLPRTQDIETQTTRVAVKHVNRPSQSTAPMSRGRRWFEALVNSANPNYISSVLCGDTKWGTEEVRAIAVVPNPHASFARAREGQFGLEEGWEVAKVVREAIKEDEGRPKRALVAIVDVPGQAFGLQEEALGIHLALAASVDAYIAARLAGHPVIALIVGKAISGAFLAHGLQANEILALDDPGVEVHVMSEASVALITRRSVEEVARFARTIPATARDIHSFAALGAINDLLACENPDVPDKRTIEICRGKLLEAIARSRNSSAGPSARLNTKAAMTSRRMSHSVREAMDKTWS